MSLKKLLIPLALFFLVTLFSQDAFSWPGSSGNYSRRYDNFSRSSSSGYSGSGNDDFSGSGSGGAGFESIDLNAELVTFRFSGAGRTRGSSSSNESDEKRDYDGNDEDKNKNSDKGSVSPVNTSQAWIADEKSMGRHTKRAYQEFKSLREEYFSSKLSNAEKRAFYKKMMKKRELFLELYDLDKTIITPDKLMISPTE